jgi:malate dehydrogenase (oxaloacetate-decarboxylating)
MFLAAARAIAELSPATRDPQANLLPPLVEIRDVTFHVAQAVARAALAEGLAPAAMPDDAVAAAIKGVMWEPVYATYRRRRA